MPGSGVLSGLRGILPSKRPFQGGRKEKSREYQTGFRSQQSFLLEIFPKTLHDGVQKSFP
jgi:hypothetical protein